MKTDPVRLVGIVAAVIIAILQALSTEGVISSDLVTNLVNIITILAPIIAAEVARRFVTPVGEPKLPIGTKVEVLTPGDQPNFSVML